MTSDNRDLHLTPDTLPPGTTSYSDDSILDSTFEERGVARLSRPPHQSRPVQYTPTTHGNAQAALPDVIHARRRLPQVSPEGGYLRGDPRQPRPDDGSLASERTAPRRLWTRQSPQMPPAIEEATRTPEHAIMSGQGTTTTTPIGMGPVTPPVRYQNSTGDNSWLPTDRETFSRPVIQTSFDLGANFGYYQASSIRPHLAPAGFRPFPLPPPPRQDVASGPLAPSDGMARRSITSQVGSRDTDASDMDFSMASFTSPTQLSHPHQPVHTSRLPGIAANNRNQGPQAPPTIESIQREIAYWQRNQTPLPSPYDIPAPPPNAGLNATYMTPEARVARQSRGELSGISSMEGGSMDISANSMEGFAGEPVAFTSVARAHIIQQSQSIQQARRRNSHSSRIDEEGSVNPAGHQVQDISDSSMSSRNGSDRPPDISDGRPQYRVDNRIDEQPELDFERYGERDAEYDREIIDTASEAEGDNGEEEDEEGEESNASSTRHLRDDELEILILENLGFHGDFTRPGKTVRLEEESSSHSDIGFNSEDDSQLDWDETGLESDTDELAIRSTEKPSRHGESKAEDRYTGNKKRKRIPRIGDKSRSKKRISEFDVDKRRKQWLSEKEDRALRRGPLMTISEQEFKEDMLATAEWKQLIHHELSTTAWKYIPVVGPGFLPSIHLAEVGHSSAHPRPVARSGMPSGPLHSTHHRMRNVNMATLAAAHEAIAFGQAGEEYGIRVLPLAAKFQQLPTDDRLNFPDADDGDARGSGDTDSESDTEMAEDSLDKAQCEDSERNHTKTYLEGSFGRLAVDDPQRAMLQDLGHM